MSTSILSVIQHYQRSIENSQGNEKRLIHCIEKLYKLPVKVEHLQETGIGKTVNSLRKYHGEIGVAAKTLVTKWKTMVAAEEESNAQANGNTDDDHANISSAPDSSDEDSDNNHYIRTPSHSNLNSSTTNKEQKSSDRHKSSTRENGKQHRSEPNSKNSSATNDKHSSKSKHDSEEKSHKSSQDNSSKHRKHENHVEEKDVPVEKKHKRDDHEKNARREGSEKQHKHEKSDKQKQRSDRHIPDSEVKPATSSKHKTASHDSKDKRDSSKSNHVHEKSSKHQDSGKHASSGGKDKHRDEKSKEDKHDKPKTSSRDKQSEHDGKSSKSTSHSASSSKSATVATPSVSNDKSTKKRQLNADDESSDETSPKPKVPKSAKHKTETNDGDDGIDSSMGANFADVLGMLNKPTKKSKKSLNALKSPNASSTSTKTSTKDDNRSKINVNPQIDSRSSSAASSSSLAKYKPSDMKPDLLTSTVKLEPLDPSIMLELPAISTNYKPLPVNPTVMECVYNNFAPPTTPKPPVRTLTDAEALSHGISSKTMRTKIYSGIKTGQILQVPSLFDLCIRVLQKNIDALEYTGGVPFEVLRPVLERATPQQLLVFEDYNPYLMEDSDVLWKHHVQRNYRCKKRQEMESWREMFLRCQDEEERRLNSLTQSIKQSQKIIAAPVRKTQLAFVDSMVKPPRNVLRKQEQYGTKSKLVATPAARVAALSSVTPNAVKVGDTRLRVAPSVRDTAQVSSSAIRPKKAPLMAKTLQSMRGLYKR